MLQPTTRSIVDKLIIVRPVRHSFIMNSVVSTLDVEPTAVIRYFINVLIYLFDMIVLEHNMEIF